MNSPFHELVAVAALTVLAVVSPGADFAMVTRQSLLQGRAAGLLAAVGIACGVQLHVLWVLLGVGVLLDQAPHWLQALRWAGAAYLVWLGCQTFRSGAPREEVRPAARVASWHAFRTGFATNALNPKTLLFVLSTFTQVVQPGAAWARQAGYGLFMSAAHLAWFAVVAVLFSNPRLRRAVLHRQRSLNRAIGAVLAGLGVWLAVG